MKKLARVLSSSILKLSLFNLALVGAAVLVLGTSAQLKQSIVDSKLYDSFVDSVLQASIDASENQVQGQSFPLSDPEIQSAAKKAFPPELLQNNLEQVIDGTYAWLDGTTAEPKFSVDFGDAKQTFAAGVGDFAVRRFNSLPACTIGQLQSLDPSIDPFNVPCQPPGVTAAMVQAQVVNEIQTSEEFLPKPVITPETMPADESGQTFAQQLSGAPGAMQTLKKLPWILATVALVAAAVTVPLHEKRRFGVRSIATTFAGTGIFLLVSTLILGYFFAQMNKPGGSISQFAEGQFQQAVVSIFRSLSIEFNSYLIRFSLAYIAIGVLLYGVLRIMQAQDHMEPITAGTPIASTNATSSTRLDTPATNADSGRDEKVQ